MTTPDQIPGDDESAFRARRAASVELANRAMQELDELVKERGALRAVAEAARDVAASEEWHASPRGTIWRSCHGSSVTHLARALLAAGYDWRKDADR